jgi:SecD/SecF fusion protein
MQNKGALKFLAIVLAIACAYQLSFTFVTRHVEKQAARYAAGDPVRIIWTPSSRSPCITSGS